MAYPAKSYYHQGSKRPLLGITIPQHFAEIVEQYPDQEAIVSLPQKRRLSYRQLAREVDQLGAALLNMGFSKGERIGIWSTNNIEWLLLQLASARIGVILVNINPAYRSKELAYALTKSEIQGLFVIPAFRGNDYVSMLCDLIPELESNASDALHSGAFPLLRRIVLYDPQNPQRTSPLQSGFTPWGQALAMANEETIRSLDSLSAALDIDDPINIQYTSGTTGFPKAVLLSHHNILNNAYFCAEALQFSENDRLAAAVPFYHCFGMVLVNLLCFSVGACVVIPCEHFDALSILRAVDAEKCTALHGVPTMFIAELDHPQFKDFDLTSLRTGIMAGAPCPPAVMKRVMRDMHCRDILIGYGETEASPLTHITSKEDGIERRIDSVGRNLAHQEVKIVDVETRQTIPLGQSGEICFRGYHIMQGYYNDPEATQRAIDPHGWLASGDLGTMDADGYVQITGRLKEMIIRGGENIYPREIEDILYTHPAIAEVAVFGVPDSFYGEEIMAWIQLHEKNSVSEPDLREFLKNRIAHFKIPRHIWFVDDFPMTVTGKLQKFRMREIALEKGHIST